MGTKIFLHTLNYLNIMSTFCYQTDIHYVDELIVSALNEYIV